MEHLFHHHQTVRFADTDAAGIVYFAEYATYFDESFIAAMRDLHGIGWDDHHKDNFLMPIVETKVRYFGPLYPGEKFTTMMGVTKVGNSSFISNHIILVQREGRKEITAEGTITRVVVNNDDFKPITIPNSFREALDNHYIDARDWEEYQASFHRR